MCDTNRVGLDCAFKGFPPKTDGHLMATKTANDWSVELHAGDLHLVESIKNATPAQQKAFEAKVFAHVKTPPESCRKPEFEGETLGSLSWYGGAKAAKAWTLYRCGSCGGIHGRLNFMA